MLAADPGLQRLTRTPPTLVVCPHCTTDLEVTQSSARCRQCRRTTPIASGIYCFDHSDPFYDAIYEQGFARYKQSPKGIKKALLKYLPYWCWREWKFWIQATPSCRRLLDIGCGRGRQLFQERSAETVGFDSSLVFLQECAQHYDTLVLGRLPLLPFRNGAFDAVMSSHVLAHVPNQDKELATAEMARVTAIGGVCAHIIETDSEHPAVMQAKQNSELYRQCFIEQHGHVGLESANMIIERFARHGFRLKKLRLVDAVIPSVLNYRTFFAPHPQYADLPAVGVSKLLHKLTKNNFLLNTAYEIGMGTFHQTAEQWLGKPAHAQFIMVVFERV